MSEAAVQEPCVISSLPGRVRVHLPEWTGAGAQALEAGLLQKPGVRTVSANPHTRNVLVVFDDNVTDTARIVRAAHDLAVDPPANVTAHPQRASERPAPPKVVRDRKGQVVRARIAVPGMDRDPEIARRVVERLQARSGVVRAVASQLTGRVLVEYIEHQEDIRDLVGEVTDVDIPDVPGESEPTFPLDPASLIQGIARLSGAALGLSLLAGGRLLGVTETSITAPAAQAASIISVLQGIPFVRNGLRRLLGRDLADLAVAAPSVVTLTASQNPLGLALVGGESLRTVTEVIPRRAAWKRYEERLGGVPSAQPGAVIRLESGERTPLEAEVIAGTGTAARLDGLPGRVEPGARVPAGARMFGGPFVLQLHGEQPFTPEPRPAPPAPTLFSRYVNATGAISLGYAGLTALFTRSFSRTLEAMMLVNPRTALIGADAAESGAAARVLRAGVIVVGTRPTRGIVRPDYLLLDSPRVLTDGFEMTGVVPLNDAYDSAELLARAAGVAQAAGSPFGGAFRAANAVGATDGTFDGTAATATSSGTRYVLRPLTDDDPVPATTRRRHRGHHLLILECEREQGPLALFALRPRLATGVAELAQSCQRAGVSVGLISAGDPVAAHALATRAHLQLLSEDDGAQAIRARQSGGALVAYVSDSARAACAFDACDLAIGMSDGRGHFPARADLLAPDLLGVAAIVDAARRRRDVVAASAALSLAGNIAGGIWAWRGRPGVERASRILYATALGSLAIGWLRLRGGERPRSAFATLTDPRPERWGRRSVESVLRAMSSSEQGLKESQASQRLHHGVSARQRHGVLDAILDQLRSPLIGMLAGGAALSLVLGAAGDVAIIGATIAANVLVGVWQERKANKVADALSQMGTSTAQVLRDGRPVVMPATGVVPGDIILLSAGDRVPGDARVIEADALEVDEAPLTGESLPVPKTVEGGADAGHIVLEGSDVTAGSGRAVVVAVGKDTRMGATAEALSVEESEGSPLGRRLGQVLRLVLPLAGAAGVIVTGTGVLRGQALLSQLALGATVAMASVPEGLPLLAGVTEAAVARRLSGQRALVRRLSAVEALGRVDIACTDKTGTLTEGRLALTLVASPETDARVPGPLPDDLRRVLLTAALACPHPDSAAAGAHPTDIAVVRAAEEQGMESALRQPHTAEAPFDPVRSLHADVVGDRLCAKGAPEAVIRRCQSVLRGGVRQDLDDAGRERLLDRARDLAGRGLRVLLVAEGPPDSSVDDPQRLTALGFVGIADPLRTNVAGAVRRCREAGVRVMMITGDHPATARAIAREAGLLDGGADGEVLTGAEIAELQNGELEQRLERATVIARATPLDKLRIIESLQRVGHVVAMTGDGVNDAPALRLADVGVAMGRGGTEVARQTADVVLADDDFATLVETFVEGRGFWRNIRRAMSLLLGGNLGELGLVVGASVLGLGSPLTVSQVLAVNLITDVLPSLSVALQRPEHRNLAALAREGTQALDTSLRQDVLRRGALTAVPSLAAYALALRAGTLPQARAVAFGSIVATQLAQTLDAGRAEGTLTRGVVAAVAGSTGVMLAAMTIPPLRGFLSLATPNPIGWALIGGGSLAALILSHGLPTSARRPGTLPRVRLLPDMGQPRLLPAPAL